MSCIKKVTVRLQNKQKNHVTVKASKGYTLKNGVCDSIKGRVSNGFAFFGSIPGTPYLSSFLGPGF